MTKLSAILWREHIHGVQGVDKEASPLRICIRWRIPRPTSSGTAAKMAQWQKVEAVVRSWELAEVP